jgi:predicted  nucleic acid-binding Zn-ribbon protein
MDGGSRNPEGDMGDETESTLPSNSAAESGKADIELNFNGQNVLSLLRQATDLAGGNSRYAVEIAQKMSDQLWAAQKRAAESQARATELEAQVQLYPARIADLEAEVQRYSARVAELEAEVKLHRDKAERAELWLGKISSEIQERVLGSD